MLTPDIFDILRKLPKGSDNEIQLVDTINSQAQTEAVDTLLLEGFDLTVGQLTAISAVTFEYKKKVNNKT